MPHPSVLPDIKAIEGKMKGLRVRLHNAVRGQPDGDIRMHMVIVEWPLRLL